MKQTKLFISPYSKNIVDAVISHTNRTEINIGIAPTRQQIDWNQGYVNNWFTDTFRDYIRQNGKFITLGRAHGGTGQGNVFDNGLESLGDDCRYGYDIVHIDPWVRYPDYLDGIQETVHAMNHCKLQNSRMLFEIGYTPDVESMLQFMETNTSVQTYDNVEFIIIEKLNEIDIVHAHGKKAKLNNAGSKYKDHQLIEFLEAGVDAIEVSTAFHMVEMYVLENDLPTKKLKKEFRKLLKLHKDDHVYTSRSWNEFVNNFNPDIEDEIKIAVKTNIRHYEKLINEFSVEATV